MFALVSQAPGCCLSGSADLDIEKYYPRNGPLSAVAGTVLAVELGNWNYAFDSLSTSSREQVGSPTRLMIAVLLLKDPHLGITARDLVTEAIRHRILVSRDDRAGIFTEMWERLTYYGNDAEGLPYGSDIPVYLHLEVVATPGDETSHTATDAGTEWRVDLVTSLIQLYGPLPEEDGAGL